MLEAVKCDACTSILALVSEVIVAAATLATTGTPLFDVKPERLSANP